MGLELGRISGTLLAENLRRDDDLTFKNNDLSDPVLFLNVSARQIGINTDSTNKLLTVNGLTSTLELVVETHLETPNFYISTNRIQNLVSAITIEPDQTTDPTVAGVRFDTANFKFTTNTVENVTADSDINFNPNGDGRVIFTTAQVNIDGDLHATGDITFDGTITFGNDNSDNVTFSADIASNIIPDVNETYDLGTSLKRWNSLYSENVLASSANITGNLIVNNINLTTLINKTLYVSVNGDDSNIGNHDHSTYRTVKYALSQAVAGDEVVIFPGTYEEEFPLIVPQGVSVRGTSIRAVNIQPTIETNTNNAFLMNGETTVSFLTVKDFYQGYAFSFAPSASITTRSPYVQTVTVITNGVNAGGGALVDGAQMALGSIEASMLFHAATFIVPNANGITATNGARVEWLNSFTYFADKGIYLTEGTVGFRTAGGTADITVGPAPTGVSLSSNSVTLSKNFYSQLLVDSLVGQTAVIDRYPAPPLFYTVVSIATEPLSPTEWRMTVDSTFNAAGQLKPISFYPDVEFTQIITTDIWDTSGSSVGEKWVAYFKTNLPSFFTTLVQPGWTINVAGTIYIVDYIIEDPINTNQWRIYVTTTLIGGVGIPIFSSPGVGTITRYGAEFRSINSANVYGNYGAVADGVNTLGYLVGHNFGYVGSGLDSSNNRSLAIQANEVFESNNGHIYYDSMDHKGDYRVGDIFYVNQETGQVTFDAQSINYTAGGNITLEGPTSVTIIDALGVQTGNIRIYDNNIDSLSGPVNLLAQSGTTNLSTDVYITGNLDLTGNVTVGGDLFLGDNPLDTVTVFPKIGQDLNPAVTDNYTLGSLFGPTPEVWRTMFLSTALNVGNIIEISSNTITTLTNDTDLEFIAAGTGVISISSSDVEITNDLTVNSPLIDTNLTNVDITGLLNLTGVNLYSLTGDADRTGNTDITGYLKVLGANTVQFEDINFIGNTISKLSTTSNLEFSTLTGTNLVKTLASDVEITNDLDVGLYGYLNQLNVTTSILATDFTADNVYITGNTITTNATDVNLVLSANGTGIVHVIDSDVEISNNLTTDSLDVDGDTSLKFVEITGNITQTGNINQTGNTYIEGTFANNNVTILNPSYITVPDFKFQDNVIQVTAPDTNLVINSLGGGVVFNRILKIADNIIGNIFDVNDIELVFNNLYLTEDNQLLLTEDGDNYLLDTNSAGDLSVRFRPSGTGKMRISSTKALAVAYGNNTNRVLGDVGEIRQNSTTGLYEGYSPNGLVSFNNIYDNDRNTYITPELTPGANDNILRFGVNSSVRATISSTILFTSNLNVDNVSITGTTISNLISTNDLELSPVGTGYVSINDILFTSNTVAPLSDSPLILESTGTGYFKFTGSGGLVFPSGNSTTERPVAPETGEVRYNSTGNYTEVFNGTNWVSASGASSAATEEEIAAETNLWAFVLG